MNYTCKYCKMLFNNKDLGMKHIHTSCEMYKIIKELKELREENKLLKNRISVLENKKGGLLYRLNKLNL